MAINISWVVCVYLEIDYQEQLPYQLFECEQDTVYADNFPRFLGAQKGQIPLACTQNTPQFYSRLSLQSNFSEPSRAYLRFQLNSFIHPRHSH